MSNSRLALRDLKSAAAAHKRLKWKGQPQVGHLRRGESSYFSFVPRLTPTVSGPGWALADPQAFYCSQRYQKSCAIRTFSFRRRRLVDYRPFPGRFHSWTRERRLREEEAPRNRPCRTNAPAMKPAARARERGRHE